MQRDVAETPERRAFYERVAGQGLVPLWAMADNLITPEPRSPVRPALWRFAELRPALLEAGRLVTAREAERRVLVFENPGLPGRGQVTTSLAAGVQMVLPGEVAPAHRHAQSALRLVLEAAEGARTVVAGECLAMRPGDLILTPSMSWHEHRNDSSEPVFWLDGVDVPLVGALAASFFDRLGADEQAQARPPGDSLARYGANLLPLDAELPRGPGSPVLRYPWERTREALEALKRVGDWDPCHGLRLRHANPATGGHALATIATFVQLLPAGFRTARHRSTDATVYCAVEGSGRTLVGNGAAALAWGPRDVFVVPGWRHVSHEAEEEAVLFGLSDRAAQESLGLFREERGDTGAAGS